MEGDSPRLGQKQGQNKPGGRSRGASQVGLPGAGELRDTGERMPVYNHGFRKKRTRALIGGNRAFYMILSRSGDFVTKR
jgi:hypothetical protein